MRFLENIVLKLLYIVEKTVFNDFIKFNRYTTLCPFRVTRILALEILRSRAEQNLLIFAHPQSHKFQSKVKLEEIIYNEY